MISKRDSKPFLIKQPVGNSEDDSENIMLYEDSWTVLYGLISDPNGRLRNQVYGNELPFDKIITVNAGSSSKQIGYDTILMVDDMPTSNYPQGDYTVKYIFPPYNGEIVIGLEKRQSVSMPRLYYYKNNTLLYYQLNFDRTTLKGYSLKNRIIPFANGDTVWTTRPDDDADTSNRYTVSGFSDVGLDQQNKNFVEFSLLEVEE